MARHRAHLLIAAQVHGHGVLDRLDDHDAAADEPTPAEAAARRMSLPLGGPPGPDAMLGRPGASAAPGSLPASAHDRQARPAARRGSLQLPTAIPVLAAPVPVPVANSAANPSSLRPAAHAPAHASGSAGFAQGRIVPRQSSGRGVGGGKGSFATLPPRSTSATTSAASSMRPAQAPSVATAARGRGAPPLAAKPKTLSGAALQALHRAADEAGNDDS
jgi:hypothetical protein